MIYKTITQLVNDTTMPEHIRKKAECEYKIAVDLFINNYNLKDNPNASIHAKKYGMLMANRIIDNENLF